MYAGCITTLKNGFSDLKSPALRIALAFSRGVNGRIEQRCFDFLVLCLDLLLAAFSEEFTPPNNYQHNRKSVEIEA